MPKRETISRGMQRLRKSIPTEKREFNEWRFSLLDDVRQRKDLTAGAKIVFEILILKYLNNQQNNPKRGLAWPSYGKLAEKVGMGIATIKRAYKELARANLIVVAHQGGPHRQNIVAFPIVISLRQTKQTKMIPTRDHNSLVNGSNRTRIYKDTHTKSNLSGLPEEKSKRRQKEEATRAIEAAFGTQRIEALSSIQPSEFEKLAVELVRGCLTRHSLVSAFRGGPWELTAEAAAQNLGLWGSG